MRQLVESWTEAERRRGNNLAVALRRLNHTCGMQITHSRVAEWRRGVYVPSQVVLSYMLNRTLPWALAEAGIIVSDVQLEALRERIWNFGEQDGQSIVELV